MSDVQNFAEGDPWKAVFRVGLIVLSPLAVYFFALVLPSVVPELGDRPKSWCTFAVVLNRPLECKDEVATIPFVAKSPCSTQDQDKASVSTVATPNAAAVTLGVARKPKTLDQAKTLELALRLGFATASNVLRLISILVLAGAAAFYFSTSYMRNWKLIVIWLFLVIGCAVAGRYLLSQDALTQKLIVGAIRNAQNQLLEGSGVHSFEQSSKINHFLGFAGKRGKFPGNLAVCTLRVESRLSDFNDL